MIKDFIKYLSYEKRYSEHTIKSYKTDIEQFCQFIVSHTDKKYTEDHKIIRLWIIKLDENGNSSRTINRKISSLKTYYKYLIKENIIKLNPLEKVNSPKVNKNLPQFVSEDDIKLLFTKITYPDDFKGIRDQLILELLYFTGIRLSELQNLQTKDIDFNAKSIKVQGKRQKERIIPISDNLIHLINIYIKRKKELSVETDQEYLFITDKGKKIYEKLIYRTVKNYLQQVTTINKKSPHILRHTFATHLLNKGADLNAIKELLGHANLSATQVYTHNTIDKLNQIYKQAHPRA